MTSHPNASSSSHSGFQLLEVKGDDSERLLQGQLTCDLTKLEPTEWMLGACCTPKGRMVGNFMIARSGDAFYLRMPAAQTSALKTYLGKYAVFYKVRIQLLDARIDQFDVEPGNSSKSETAPESPVRWQLDQDGQPKCAQIAWPDRRLEIWKFQPESSALDNALPEETSTKPLTAQQIAALDIASGLVWVTQISQEAWIPQHIGWDKQNGVSFTKGCYTGQEVVARLQYLGKAKRYLVKASTDQSAVIAPCSQVKVGEKQIGEIAAWSGNQGLLILSVAQSQLEELLIDSAAQVDSLDDERIVIRPGETIWPEVEEHTN